MKNATLTIFLMFLITGCSYGWQCECYEPSPFSINDNRLLMLGYLNPITNNEDIEGKPFYTKPYSFHFVIRSSDQLPEDVLIEQISVIGPNNFRTALLKDPTVMDMTGLSPQAFGGMKNELSYETEPINIDINNHSNVQIIVSLLYGGKNKELTFKFTGKLRKLSAPIL